MGEVRKPGYTGASVWYNEVPSGAVDGHNKAFTVSRLPTGAFFLTQNGLWLTAGLDYSRDGVHLTVATTPLPGDQLAAVYTA